tara:strand:+ start:280 stop:450 length:171 start_codon:yes stop_codon:yes gene_type:complete
MVFNPFHTSLNDECDTHDAGPISSRGRCVRTTRQLLGGLTAFGMTRDAIAKLNRTL